MNYLKHYHALMERAIHRELDCYVELHHITPKCFGGSDDADNLVYLTAREHYVAHQLLVKMFPEDKGLPYAAMIMTTGNDAQGRHDNTLYSWIYIKVCQAAESKPVSTPHGLFRSVKNASEELGIPRTTLRDRLNSTTKQMVEWKFI